MLESPAHAVKAGLAREGRHFDASISEDRLCGFDGASALPRAFARAMVLEITYLDRAAMAAALASPVRSESREATKGLFDHFEGRILHAVYGLEDQPSSGSFG